MKCQYENDRSSIYGSVCPRCNEIIPPDIQSPLTQKLDADAESDKDLVRQYLKSKLGDRNAH
jgi:hypothetical protein